MFQILRPLFFLLAAPVVIIVGTLAGIHSANTEQSSMQLTPHPADPAAIVRNLPSVLAGRVMRFDVPAAAIIVQRLDGKTVRVFLKAATVVKFGTIRVRARDIQVGDIVTVIGRPVPNQGVTAALITIMPRKDRQPPTATPAANNGS
jgi:hypothetical protein